MYSPLKRATLALLKVPPEPADPSGAPGSLIVFRAGRNYLRYRYVMLALKFLWSGAILALLLPGLWMGLREAPAPMRSFFLFAELVTVISIVGGALLGFVTTRLDFEMRWYKVTDRSLRIREGIWSVREVTMTFANVQNVSIDQGPLQRMLGIADLKVQSAGGGGADAGKKREGAGADMHVAYFRGIDNAEHVRDVVLDRLRRYRDSGLGDADEAHAAHLAAPSGDVLAALAAVRDEARALREALAAR